MGDYITQSDLEDRFPAADLVAVTDDEGAGTVNAARISAAIVDAEGEANAILSQGGLEVPISPVPDRLVTLTVALAWFYLCRRRNVVPEQVQKDYDKAVENLQTMAKHGATGGDEVPSMHTSWKPRQSAPARKFDDDTMGGL